MFQAESSVQVLVSYYLYYCSLIGYLFHSNYGTGLWVVTIALGLPDVCACIVFKQLKDLPNILI